LFLLRVVTFGASFLAIFSLLMIAVRVTLPSVVGWLRLMMSLWFVGVLLAMLSAIPYAVASTPINVFSSPTFAGDFPPLIATSAGESALGHFR
jgi:hypothetical protein